MRARRPLLIGIALLAAALVLVLLATGLRGPLDPSCSGARAYTAECFSLAPTLLFALALPLAIAGGVALAIWLGRRAAGDEEQRP
jgi:hypothetical protein